MKEGQGQPSPSWCTSPNTHQRRKEEEPVLGELLAESWSVGGIPLAGW